MTFGERLKKLRTDKGITQEKLGNIIGVSDRVIGYYEADNRFPKDDILLNKIADYFDVSLDYLLGRTENEKLVQDIDKKMQDNNIVIAANSKVDLGKLAKADSRITRMINILLDDFENDDDNDE